MMPEPTYTVGPSSQPLFIEPPHIETSPHQALDAPDHMPWMDLSTKINSLDIRMEELEVVNDTQFYSMEDHMDQYQTSFTSQFEYLQRFEHMEDHMDQEQATFEHLHQMIDGMESHQESQHKEMMTYLHSMFPPPPPQP